MACTAKIWHRLHRFWSQTYGYHSVLDRSEPFWAYITQFLQQKWNGHSLYRWCSIAIQNVQSITHLTLSTLYDRAKCHAFRNSRAGFPWNACPAPISSYSLQWLRLPQILDSSTTTTKPLFKCLRVFNTNPKNI